MEKNTIKLYFIRFAYLFGAIADLLIVLAWIAYSFFNIFIYIDGMGFPKPPVSIELKTNLGISIGLMIGWTVLLFWGLKDPIKNRVTLLFTSLLFILGPFIEGLLLFTNNSFYTIDLYIGSNISRLIFGPIYLIGYILSNQTHSQNNKNKPEIILNDINPPIISPKKLTFIKIIYWVGIILDGYMVIIMILYIFENDIGLTMIGIPHYSDANAIAINSGIGLMIAWTILLIWAVKDPIRRKSILLITVFGVLGIFLIYEICVDIQFNNIITLSIILGSYLSRIILIILFSFAYHFCKEK